MGRAVTGLASLGQSRDLEIRHADGADSNTEDVPVINIGRQRVCKIIQVTSIGTVGQQILLLAIANLQHLAKGEMLEIGDRQQQYLLANRSYTSDPNDFAYTLPADVGDRYIFSITISTVGMPYFKISALPQGGQASDGPAPLTLDSEGVKEPADKWAR